MPKKEKERQEACAGLDDSKEQERLEWLELPVGDSKLALRRQFD